MSGLEVRRPYDKPIHVYLIFSFLYLCNKKDSLIDQGSLMLDLIVEDWLQAAETK